MKVSSVFKSVLTMSKKMIYVYDGLGNSERSFKMLMAALNDVCSGTSYCVKKISPREIRNESNSWSGDAELLVIGGGYDLGFIEALDKDGMHNIRQYVEDGGSYLGLCAGGYFGCAHIEFDKDGPLAVCGDRPLEFHRGLCTGPVLPGFEYKTEKGAHAPSVSWDISNLFEAPTTSERDVIKLFCYFNGGGEFKSADSAMPVSGTLGQYLEGGLQTAAAVKCDVGRGVAVLSGVHIEYNSKDLPPDDPYLASVIPKLEESEEKRNLVWRSVLKHLRIMI